MDMTSMIKGNKQYLRIRKSTVARIEKEKRLFTVILLALAAVPVILGGIILYNYKYGTSILALYPYEFKFLVSELVIIVLGFFVIVFILGHYSKEFNSRIIYWNCISEENKKSARYAVEKFCLSQDPVEIIADEDVLTSEQVSLIQKHGSKLYAQIFMKKILIFIEEPNGTRHNVEFLNDFTYFINSYIPAEEPENN